MNTLLKTLAIAGVAFSLNTTVQAGELDTDASANQFKAVQQKQKQVKNAQNNADAYTAQAGAAKKDAKTAKKAKKEVTSELRDTEQDLINNVKKDLSFFQSHKDKIIGALVVIAPLALLRFFRKTWLETIFVL